MSTSLGEIEKKTSINYLIELNNQLQSTFNLNLEFSNNQRLDFINYFELNRFICKYFTYNFISEELILFNFGDRFGFTVNEEGAIVELHNKKLIEFFAQKNLVSKLNNEIFNVYNKFCDDYILFFTKNFRRDFFEKYISNLDLTGSTNFSLDYKPKFLIRKNVIQRDVVKRYKRAEGKSYTHYFTFKFIFDILDNSILENDKFKKCQELLLNNTLEVVDNSDDDCESFSTIYDNVKIFSGQIDYSLTNQVNHYVQNGNLLEDPDLKYSSIEFKEDSYKFHEQKLKALFFLLSCDIDNFVNERYQKVYMKVPFVEYLFFLYNFYIDNKSKIDFRYYQTSFSYDFSTFRFLEKFNSEIVSFMINNLPQNILSSFDNIFLKQKIECNREELNEKVDILFLKFLRYTFDNKL